MSESATERQKVKLRFFDIKFPPTITKEEASSLLDKIDDAERESAYRKYRDQLDAKQSEADDLALRIEAWRASVEIRDDMYHKVSRRIIRDVVCSLDAQSPDWEKNGSNLFYETLEKRHPEVIRP